MAAIDAGTDAVYIALQFGGKVLEVKADAYIIENYEKLNNGDRLYFINANGEANGTQINTLSIM